MRRICGFQRKALVKGDPELEAGNPNPWQSLLSILTRGLSTAMNSNRNTPYQWLPRACQSASLVLSLDRTPTLFPPTMPSELPGSPPPDPLSFQLAQEPEHTCAPRAATAASGYPGVRIHISCHAHLGSVLVAFCPLDEEEGTLGSFLDKRGKYTSDLKFLHLKRKDPSWQRWASCLCEGPGVTHTLGLVGHRSLPRQLASTSVALDGRQPLVMWKRRRHLSSYKIKLVTGTKIWISYHFHKSSDISLLPFIFLPLKKCESHFLSSQVTPKQGED